MLELKREKEEKLCIKKRQRWEPIGKKYRANKSLKTQVMKENNQDTTNTLIK
jgi:hypothetical protein